MSIIERTRRWWQGHVTVETAPAAPPVSGGKRGSVDHVVILDGTLSTLEPGQEGNAGLLYRLLTSGPRTAKRTVYYEPGQQWEGWRRGMNIVEGRGINPQIRRAYGWLASHYQPGDRIFLFGYSRGAYAVRSLAGAIDRIGLLRREQATQRGVNLAFRHYKRGPDTPAADDFARAFCHPAAPIQMIGVWDTVKALGSGLPMLWMIPSKRHMFHDHRLGPSILHGFHALARDETRVVFEPVLWDTPQAELTPDHRGARIQQAWFAGAHGDIGGNIGRFSQCRPLANIPLVWMLERAESVGLTLPQGWRELYPCDPNAPMVGTFRGFGLWFIMRRKRVIGGDTSEFIHPSAAQRRPRIWPFR